jgi:hypothetical protein
VGCHECRRFGRGILSNLNALCSGCVQVTEVSCWLLNVGHYDADQAWNAGALFISPSDEIGGWVDRGLDDSKMKSEGYHALY